MASNFTLEAVQDDILAYLRSQFPQKVVEQAVPDIDTVERVDGYIVPYLSVHFGDIYADGNRAMSGAFDDDYRLPVRIVAIAPDADVARKLSNKVVRVLLGKTFPWAGQVRKGRGGGMFTATASNSATEAYAFPSSFSILVQLHISD